MTFVNVGGWGGGGGGSPPGPGKRSGSALGSMGGNQRNAPTGAHFGHHKTHSKAGPVPLGHPKKHRKRKPVKPKKHSHPRLKKKPGLKRLKGLKAPRQGQTTMATSDLLTYFPPLTAFIPQSMDVYTGNASIPAPGGNKRSSNVNMSITGTFLEGMRQRVQSSFAYSHIILCDPGVEIRDGYGGDTSAETQASQDQLMIPAGQTQNVWLVILSFVTILPNIGRRKVILADRRAAGNWPTLL
jgi:hypothetical protein